jgi:hypothetical protein
MAICSQLRQHCSRREGFLVFAEICASIFPALQ